MLQVRSQPWRTSSCCQICGRQSLLVAAVASVCGFSVIVPSACSTCVLLFIHAHVLPLLQTCGYPWQCFLLFLSSLFSSVSSPFAHLGCHCVMRANGTTKVLADTWHQLCPHVQSWLPLHLCAWGPEKSPVWVSFEWAVHLWELSTFSWCEGALSTN